MKWLAPIVALLILAPGCCTVTSGAFRGSPACQEAHARINWESSLTKLEGTLVDESMIAWGPPSSQQRLSQGRVMYTWLRGSEVRTSSQTTGGNIGDMHVANSRSSTVMRSCQINLVTDASGIVETSSWQGKACW